MHKSLILVALAGCSSLDEAVSVDVAQATIAVAPASPDSLATTDLSLHLTALSRADHELALDRVALEPPGATEETELAVAAFAPFWIHANESKDLSLANAGTTNRELSAFCGETANLFVYVTFLDASSGTHTEGTWTGTSVAIACP